MADQLILVGAIASLFSFALFFLLGKKQKSTNITNLVQTQSNKCAKTAHDGDCKPEMVGHPDIIIIGAGVAGSALACTLGKDGRRVLVVERDLAEPDRIVGELLQPGGYLKLIELGLEDCVNEIDAQQVFGYALFKDGKSSRLSYPLKGFHSDVTGKSFHNGRFIQRMCEKAATFSNVKLVHGTVTSLVERKGTVKGVHYKTKAGQDMTAYAPLTIVCDGCFSNLRRSLCNPKVDIPSCFVALILKNCQLPYPNHGHVILANPSPILLYRISSTEIRCLVDVPGKKLPSIANGDMTQYLKTPVAPQLPLELYDAFVTAIDEGNMRTMANRSMPAAPYPTPGALLLGDAFNMRHPLTGGGMTVALSDIVVLGDLLRPLNDLNDASALCRYLESFYTLRKPVASTINTLAGALYKVFCASPDQARNEMRQACFDYLSLGGIFSEGPVALLSGLHPRPLSLVVHFFSVAVYGVGRLLLPFPSPKQVRLGARLISTVLEMDLETENRIAAILMKEAAELRRQAEKDGVHAYLRQPNVRCRPNSRFLTATVLGVEQANRAVEVNEMWQIRQKEQELDDRLKRRRRDESSSDRSYREPELDDKLKRRRKDESSSDRSYRDTEDLWRSTNKSHADGERKTSEYCSSKRIIQDYHLNEGEGLRDDEVENFLNSRVKRGRGAVGSRMDETGPYLPSCPDYKGNQLAIPYVAAIEEWEHNANLCLEKPSRLKSLNSSEDDESFEHKHKKTNKASSSKHNRKHKSKEKSKDKKRKRKEERRHKLRK